MSTPILEIRNLKKYYKVGPNKKNDLKAVDDVSFTVHKGEIFGIVGESGCGKSTMGKSILRLIEPTEGEVILNGEDLVKLDSAEMREKRKDILIKSE